VPYKGSEVQILQAEVAMQEVQLRRLLTAHPGEHVPYEVAFEAARLWQGLEGIRAVIATLQEQCGDKDVSSLRPGQIIAGFVEDAFVDAYHAKRQQFYEMKPCSVNGGAYSGAAFPTASSDGFDEIARLEEKSAEVQISGRTGWKPEDDVRISTSGTKLRDLLAAETRIAGATGATGGTGAPVRKRFFRGLVRGSGSGGGASGRNVPREKHNAQEQTERTTSPLRQSPPTAAPAPARRTEPLHKQPLSCNASVRKPSPKRVVRPIVTARADRAPSPSRSRKESPPRRESPLRREAPQRRECPPRRKESPPRAVNARPKAAPSATSSESKGLLAARPRSRPSSPWSPRSASSTNSGVTRTQVKTTKALF